MDYVVNLKNNSKINGVFCIYQTHEYMDPDEYKSLAWLTQDVASDAEAILKWTNNYCFVFSDTSILKTGNNFHVTQRKDSNLSHANDITLSPLGNSFTFSEPVSNSNHDCFFIHQASEIQDNKASIGIGMHDYAAFATEAHQNMTSIFFPNPKYWVIFGKIKCGDIMILLKYYNKAVNLSSFTEPVELTFKDSKIANVQLDTSNVIKVSYSV